MTTDNKYGASLSLWEKLRLFQEWAPVMTFVQAFLATDDPHRKAIVVAECCEWLASKTDATKVDDELVSHISAVLRSDEGEAFLRWVIGKVQA
ncbi:hypothetical protein EBZ80_19315 [bacterium]|nr:hypothetical protein [bacterium]